MRSLLTTAAFCLLVACGGTSQRLSLGSPCTPGSDECITELCVALDDQSGFCTASCTTGEECPEGFLCQPAGRHGRICRPLTGCTTETDCPSGHTCNADTGNCYIAVSRQLCAPCDDVAQCPAGGACFTAVGTGETFCTTACGDNDSCPDGYACRELPLGGGEVRKQCAPVKETCSAGRPLCGACQGDNECGGAYDLCVRNVVSGETFCGRDCNPAKNLCPGEEECEPALLDQAENPDCETGFACTNIGKSDDPNVVGPYQCVPNSNTCQGYCDGDGAGQLSGCGIGQVCIDHLCVPAIDGRMCSPCDDHDDCRVGGFAENRCIVNNCGDCPFYGESFCSTPCADDAACVRSFGPGFVCEPVDDASGPPRSYCMPQRGTCQTGLGRLGEDCSVAGAQDCVAGVCLKSGLTAFCSNQCAADSDCADNRFLCCEVSEATGGYDCSAERRTAGGPLSGSGVCAPHGGLFGDDCSPGRAPCQSGTCLDLGTARLCTVTCADNDCPENFSCRAAFGPDGESQLNVCFPNGGGQPGSNCTFGPAACETGLCIRKDSGAICSQYCDGGAACPDGWVCELQLTVTQQSVQACLPPALQGG